MADVEVERDERGTTLNFAILDATERKVAAVLFDLGRTREVPYYPFLDGTYDETPDGIQWLANDASTLVASWRRASTRESLVAAAIDTGLIPEDERTDWGDAYINAAMRTLEATDD